MSAMRRYDPHNRGDRTIVGVHPVVRNAEIRSAQSWGRTIVGVDQVARNGGIVGGSPLVRNDGIVGAHPLVRNAVVARNKVLKKPAR